MSSHRQKNLNPRVNDLPATKPTASFISHLCVLQLLVWMSSANCTWALVVPQMRVHLVLRLGVEGLTNWNTRKTTQTQEDLTGTEPLSSPSTYSFLCFPRSPPASLVAMTAEEQVHEKAASRRRSIKRAGRGGRLPGESLRGFCASAAGCHAGGSDWGPGANKVGHHQQQQLQQQLEITEEKQETRHNNCFLTESYYHLYG